MSKPSPAMVVALLALFISLGGVSWAVATGSVGTRAVKDGSLQSRDVRDGTLQARDVANGKLLGSDVRDGTLRTQDVRDGTLIGKDVANGGLAGINLAPNSIGDREINEPQLDVQRLGGLDAEAYVRNVKQVRTQTGSDTGSPKSAPPASCPKGRQLLGGGAHVTPPTAPVALSVSGPSGNAWLATAYATAPTGNWQLVSVAICG